MCDPNTRRIHFIIFALSRIDGTLPYTYIYIYIYVYGNVPSIRDKANMIKCILRVFGSHTMSYSMICSRFCLLRYSGRRRLFPTEYCQKWWQFIDLRFLLDFIAVAGAFSRLNDIENHDKLYYSCFILVYSGHRVFFRLDIVKDNDNSLIYGFYVLL